MRFRGAWWLIASTLVVAGCGGSSTTTTTQTAPAVSSVSPAAGSTGVAVTTPVTATFNEVMNGSTFTSKTFTLTAAGGTAVTGNVSYTAGTAMATFTPASPLAYNTMYTATITTGVQNPAGTALGASDTWSFTTAPGAAPTVTAVTPSDGSTGVIASTTVTALFSESMNTSSINSSTFTLTALSSSGNTPVTGSIAISTTIVTNDTATFTPSAPLSLNTTYMATITTGVMGSTGSAIANADSWSFTTAAGPVPTVISTTPANTTPPTTGVSVTAPNITAVFSETMDTSTFTNSTFTLTGPGNTAVSGTVGYATTNVTNDTATFTLAPGTTLAYGTTYTAVVTTGAEALASGNPDVPLAADYIWSFTTMPAPAPVISGVTPASGSTGVSTTAANTDITVTFAAPMNVLTINNSTFTLAEPTGLVAGNISANTAGTTFTLTPTANLLSGTTYTATILPGAETSFGVSLAQPYSWTFTTTATAPTVTATTPAGGASNVNAANAITATFSEPMNPSTLNSSTFTVTSGSSAVAGTVTYNSGSNMATFTPSTTLAYGTTYTATIASGTTGALSSTGLPLASNYSWTFETGSSPNAVTVSFGTTYQTINGFGGSTAWQGQMTSAQATTLYGTSATTSTDLGLSILRVRIDPTGSAPTWVPSDGDWAYEAANAKAAVAANSKAIVFATPWTPPPSMKLGDPSQPFWTGTASSGGICGTGGSDSADYCGGYLNPSDYAAYAAYLQDFITYFNTNSGTKLYAISMQNEPDYADVNYESCYWTPAQMDTWIDDEVSAISAMSPTKLMMPESFNFNVAQAAPSLADTVAEEEIGIVAGHLYGVSPSYYTTAENDGLPVWMTEHSLCPVASTDGCLTSFPAPTITDAIAAAEEVHNSMVTGLYSAYVWWGMLGTSGVQTSVGNVGLINSNGTPTYYGYAIGQFAKFVQPGYLRVSATANPASGVYVSAYTGTVGTTHHYVIVAINANTTVENINFSLSDAATGITSLTPYETTSTNTLAPESAIAVTGGQFYYTLPAQSITTFVQ